MNYEILIYIGYIGGMVGIISSIYLFVKLNIKKAFCDLTGLTTRKELKELNKKNQRQIHIISKMEENLSEDLSSEISDHDTVLLMNVQDKEPNEQVQREMATTRILTDDVYEETTVLTTEGITLEREEEAPVKNVQDDFVIFTDVTVVHTDEKI